MSGPRLTRVTLIALLALAAAEPLFSQSTPGISDSALQQIQNILAEKRSRTSTQIKLDPTLLYTARTAAGLSTGTVSDVVAPTATLDTSGRVQADIRAAVSDALLVRIQNLGGEIVSAFPQYGAIRANLPILQVENVAGDPDVQAVSVAESFKHNGPPRPFGYASGSALRRMASLDQMFGILPLAPKYSWSVSSMLGRSGLAFIGSVTSQGWVSHQANLVVNNMAIDGTGVKIGVLSDSASAATVNALIVTGDLPPDTTVLLNQAGTGSDEGAAMMEIVHDLAPGAKLYFATANGGQANFASNILALRAAGCDIIVDDITYFAEGAFQDGIPAGAVNNVVADGALYFSSAANNGNLTSGWSGTWEGDFLDGGAAGLPVTESGRLHNFRTPGSPQLYNSITRATSLITLKWADPLGASTNDFDLFILDSTGTTVKGFSTRAQTGTQDPYEQVNQGVNCGTASARGYCPAVGDRIVVVLFSGLPRALHVDTWGGFLSIPTTGATSTHNAAANAIGVAATYWNSAHTGTRPFTGAANPVEPFSSDGPRKMFFNSDGTPITPGNFLFGTNGGITLQKPDITAADGTYAKTPGFLPFFGTSAAAPHAAAIAGLVKSARPSLTNAQIYTIMIGTALDNMSPGADRNGGFGIVMALPAVQSAQQH